jgi:NTE family protein
MPFFSFGKKFELGQGRDLSQIPLFSSLSGSQLRALEKKVRQVEFKKGDWIYRQGEEGRAFYVIISGRVKIYQDERPGEFKTITTLYRGDYFGEVSLLTDSPHTVSVQAQNDVFLLKLEKDDFRGLIKEVPPLSVYLSRSMGVRLSRQNALADSQGEAKIVSVYHTRSGIGKTVFLHNLTASLIKETGRKAVILNLSLPHSEGRKGKEIYTGESIVLDEIDFSENPRWKEKIVRREGGISTLSIDAQEATEDLVSRFVSLMSGLLRDFNYVMVDLPRELNDLVIKVMEQSDAVYILTDISSDPLERTRGILTELKDYFRFTKEHIRILAVEREMPARLTLHQIEKLLRFPIFYRIPYEKDLGEAGRDKDPLVLREPDRAYSRALRYLARELGEVLIGLALGSGAAYGLAHVGVIKVLEEEGIPVDVVSGSSIGALVGAMWTSGMSAARMEKEARRLKGGWKTFFTLVGFRDLVFPLMGFFKGKRIYKYLKSLIGEIHFQDLKTQLLVPTADMFTSEEVVFREGEVARAVKASVAIPGIIRPVLISHRYLTDGGIIDPLPVQILQEAGCRRIIAVNVLLSPEDFKERSALYLERKEEKEAKVRDKWMLTQSFHFFKRRFQKVCSTNIFNVLMNTIQFMEYTLAKAQGMDADVVIHPVIPSSGWAEFFSPEKFIAVGEMKTREVLPEIKRLVEEK